MIKARASGSKVYLYFMKKGRQARHRIPRNSGSFPPSLDAPYEIWSFVAFELIFEIQMTLIKGQNMTLTLILKTFHIVI